jgi:hypothetical protein
MALAAAPFNAGQYRFAAIVVALVAFLLAATVLSRAGELARTLAPYVKRSVHVQVWGTALPATDGSPLEVDSIRALSAGLLIHLRPGAGGARTLLKVAQSGAARLEDDRLEIAEARYVSWGGTKMKREPGHPAVTISVVR